MKTAPPPEDDNNGVDADNADADGVEASEGSDAQSDPEPEETAETVSVPFGNDDGPSDDSAEETDERTADDGADGAGGIGGWLTVAVAIAVLAFISNITGSGTQSQTPDPYMR